MRPKPRPRWAHGVQSIAVVLSPFDRFPGWLNMAMSVAIAFLPAVLVRWLLSSSGWGVATLFGILFLLALVEVYRRVRRDALLAALDEDELVQWHDRLYGALLGLEGAYHNLALASTPAEADQCRDAIDKAVAEGYQQINEVQQAVAARFGGAKRRLFDTHMALGRVPPPHVAQTAHPVWRDIANRLDWVAEQLAEQAKLGSRVNLETKENNT